MHLCIITICIITISAVTSKLIKTRRDALNAGSQNSEVEMSVIYRLGERTGGTESHSLVVLQLSSWPSRPLSCPRLTAFMYECNRRDGFAAWEPQHEGKGLECSHVGGQEMRGSWGLLVGLITMVASQMRVSSKIIIIAVHKVLHSDDSRKVSFLNVPSRPTITSEGPAQQWLAGSDAIYPSGIRKILCEPQSTHSRPSSRQ